MEKILELDIDIDAIVKKQADLRKELDNTRASMKALDRATEEGREQYIKQEASVKALSVEYNKNKKSLSELGVESKNFSEVKKDVNRLTELEVKSVDQARQSNKELLAIRNKLNVKTKEGREAQEQINKKLDENNQFITKNVSGLEKQKIGIGDYEGAIKRAFPQLSGLIDGVKTTTTSLQVQKTALQGSTVATGGLTKASKVLKIALLSTGIGAIVVALGAMVTFLTSTQRGMDAVTSATKPLQIIFSKMLGVVQDLGGDLYDAFSNPKQALMDLANLVKNNLINRFTAFGKILDGIMNLDFKKVADGTLQATTGVENFIGKVQDAAKSTSNFIGEAQKDAARLVEIEREIETAEANINLQREEALTKIKELELIAKNTAVSAKERNAAGEEAVNLAKDLAEKEKEIINLKIEEETINQKQNDSGRKELKVLNDLKAQAIAKDREAQAVELRFISTKSALAKEQAAERKKNAEELIKQQEQEAIARTQQLTDELELFRLQNKSKLEAGQELTDELLAQEEERLQIIFSKNLEILESKKLNETQYQIESLRLENEYFQSRKELQDQFDLAEKERLLIQKENEAIRYEEELQLRILRGESQRQIELSELEEQYNKEIELYKDKEDVIKGITKEYRDSRIKINAAAVNSRLTGLNEIVSAVKNTAGEESKLGKLAAITQATINVAQGVTKAIAQGGLAGIATGALVAAAGAKSVSQIVNQKLPKYKTGGFEVGGKKHEHGGTKYFGEDGNAFEVEKGEKIFILNSLASPFANSLQHLNNSINHNINSSVAGMYRNGGFLPNSTSSSGIDYGKLQKLISSAVVEAVKNIPPPRIGIDMINEAQNEVKILENDATF